MNDDDDDDENEKDKDEQRMMLFILRYTRCFHNDIDRDARDISDRSHSS